MLQRLATFFAGHPAADVDVDPISHSPAEMNAFAERLAVINSDPYLCVADTRLKLISVFDDLKYDRADMDLLSGPMRRRIMEKLAPLGFRQVSGAVLENTALDIRMHMPKFRALGASPFDATRDTPRRSQDYFILTPTQAACFIIDNYGLGDAIDKIAELVTHQPVNLLRLSDYLERKDIHQAASRAIGHLVLVQRKAVEEEPLCRRRALR